MSNLLTSSEVGVFRLLYAASHCTRVSFEVPPQCVMLFQSCNLYVLLERHDDVTSIASFKPDVMLSGRMPHAINLIALLGNTRQQGIDAQSNHAKRAPKLSVALSVNLCNLYPTTHFEQVDR
jgi:hypothetical protein